jgi:hypothetical protein
MIKTQTVVLRRSSSNDQMTQSPDKWNWSELLQPWAERGSPGSGGESMKTKKWIENKRIEFKNSLRRPTRPG